MRCILVITSGLGVYASTTSSAAVTGEEVAVVQNAQVDQLVADGAVSEELAKKLHIDDDKWEKASTKFQDGMPPVNVEFDWQTNHQTELVNVLV